MDRRRRSRKPDVEKWSEIWLEQASERIEVAILYDEMESDL